MSVIFTWLCVKSQTMEDMYVVKAKCVVFDGLTWMKRISAYFTVVVMNDKTLLLLPLTRVTVLIKSGNYVGVDISLSEKQKL